MRSSLSLLPGQSPKPSTGGRGTPRGSQFSLHSLRPACTRVAWSTHQTLVSSLCQARRIGISKGRAKGVYMCLRGCTCANAGVWTHAWRPEDSIIVSLHFSLPYFLRQGLSLNLELTDFAGLPSQQTPGISACLCPHSHHTHALFLTHVLPLQLPQDKHEENHGQIKA